MPSLSARTVLPVVTSVAATLFLVTAVPHGLDAEFAAAAVTPQSVTRAEVQRCMGAGREADACLDEVDGKALIERADWLARADGTGRRGRSQ